MKLPTKSQNFAKILQGYTPYWTFIFQNWVKFSVLRSHTVTRTILSGRGQFNILFGAIVSVVEH